MGILDKLTGWISPINKALDIVAEAVPDVDKRLELEAQLNQLKENVYLAELQTQTTPLADSLHKLSRPIISIISAVIGGIVLYLNPDMDIQKLLTAFGPAGLYIGLKGKGK